MLRLAKRLSKQTVAKRAKMTPTTYGNIEAGKHTRTRKLQDLADVFGVPIEDVLMDRTHEHATAAPSDLDALRREVAALRAEVTRGLPTTITELASIAKQFGQAREGTKKRQPRK